MKNFQPQHDHPAVQDIAICWFRRDLRLEDNAALYHALKENEKVLPLFIFDTEILDSLDEKIDRRVEFIHQSLQILRTQLEALGSSILILHGNPVELFKNLRPHSVYTNFDYEPYAIRRDRAVESTLTSRGISFKTYKDQVIFEKDEIVKTDGKPYTVFTPYSRTWKAKLTPFYLKGYPSEKYFKNLKQTEPLHFPPLSEIGFQAGGLPFPERVVKTSIITKYHLERNFPGTNGTTRLSVHLRFGTISIRTLASLALKKNETWLNELIWRDFYQMILWHYPHVEFDAFKPAYNRIAWKNDPAEFKAWCEGHTGYPIVDAGIRELNATGFMHNRVRMITASFLTKHLLIDWRWGEAYFAKKLLDFDMASNNGGWQWAAGSGCDAAPYFRIFNPELQTLKFDKKLVYVKKWVPEFETLEYVQPIVDHKAARERALNTYKTALER